MRARRWWNVVQKNGKWVGSSHQEEEEEERGQEEEEEEGERGLGR